MAHDDRVGGSRAPVRVVVVVSNEVSRGLLVERLARADGLDVVGEAGTVADALAAIRGAVAEVVVVDAVLSDGSGDQVCRRLRLGGDRCGCVVSAGLPPALGAPSTPGVDALVLKEVGGDQLESEIRRVGTAVRSGCSDSANR